MRLADFVLENTEQILVEWEAFARTVSPAPTRAPLALRDHAEELLRATARDMMSAQSAAEQSNKSRGSGHDTAEGGRLDGVSNIHALERVTSGFDLLAVVAEYRALRASVLRLWRESAPPPDDRDLDDVTRFNESIDQSLTKTVGSYTQRIDRSRQMFLAILGHDLRNPLNSMMMSAQLLTATGHLDAEAAREASQISASATAMGHMISDLLDFTGAGLGVPMPLTPTPMDLKKLCDEVVSEMRAAYPGRQLRFEAQGDLTGAWDAARLRQVISNLLGNAIQHGHATGPIDLKVTATENEIELSVHNGGPPIPADALSTIFDPLVRGLTPELQKQRRPGSIGLGLHIAKEVVTAHRGTIEVTSTEQAGTLFKVHLPRKRAKQK